MTLAEALAWTFMPNILPIHPFPARMAPEIALDEINNLPTSATILDPMMGSGTVLRVAIENNHRAIGRDLDPLAILMSNVWTTPIDREELKQIASAIVVKAQAMKDEEVSISWIDNDPETQKFIEFWFAEPQTNDLRRLVRSIDLSTENQAITHALKLAISKIIITKDRGASLARDTSHSRPHRVALTNDYDVMQGFLQSVNRLAPRLSFSHASTNCDAALGDARSLPSIPDSSIDAVITSPPYLNAIDYMRGHRLALVWLGHRLSDLRQIRSTVIGVERAIAQDADHDLAKLVLEYLDVEHQLPQREANMVKRYVVDLHAMLSEIQRVLKPSGRAVLVVGNSNIRGVFVSNANAVLKIAEHIGLGYVSNRERELPANKRYLPPPIEQGKSNLTKRMRTESVLTFVR